MKISLEKPFELIYSIYEHEYLGYLIAPFAVQLNKKGNFTLSYQNISHKNAHEFASGLEHEDEEIIKWADEMQPESLAKRFGKKKQKSSEFFLKMYDKTTGKKDVQKEINDYLELRRKNILQHIRSKRIFEMNKDGEPTGKELQKFEEKATVLFHFRKNEDNTHYFPTVKLCEKKINLLDETSYILCENPAWMVNNGRLFTFKKQVNGGKLKPFLKKKYILISQEIEKRYYEQFICPLIAEFDIYAKGFEIKTHKSVPTPRLTVSEVMTGSSPSLFEHNRPPISYRNKEKVLFELSFDYGAHSFSADTLSKANVLLEHTTEGYVFHRITREQKKEKELIALLSEKGLRLKRSRVVMSKNLAFDWISKNHVFLQQFILDQKTKDKKFYLGESIIHLEVREGVDWFDLNAHIRFGEFDIPFSLLRKEILKGKSEITLPNGEVGIIPSSWLHRYADLLAFSEESEKGIHLHKAHFSMVNSLKEEGLANVSMTEKLEKLLSFDQIISHQGPAFFEGKLRPYQLAGYNWLRFLEEYRFGGCLADDMGLGKTIQALALLQHQKNERPEATNLIVMPTSLLYNWEKEANTFTPRLKVLNYTGHMRKKDANQFYRYDIVITSYGVTRKDTDILSDFYFNYIMLDESQAIKNPDSLISKKVRLLRSRQKLILSGTPMENSTLDLWSQMNFLNPGLLGNKAYFKKEFLLPIEKKGDPIKIQKLNAIIKPFVLRRGKGQVAVDLPEKVVNIRYCIMSEAQQKIYEEEKNAFRNRIMDVIERDGMAKSHLLILQGLTRLRQLANHPKMIDPNYQQEAGKLEVVTYMIENILSKKHKILIFSQYVKHLKIISDYLIKKEIPFAYLDGSTKNRKKEVEKFQEQAHIPIFLISLKAGGTGLNLTKAEYVFLLDPWWNPAVENQAIDRAHRIGQKKKVVAYKFVTKDTIEEKIIKLQDRKEKLASAVIHVEESLIKSLSKNDIHQLFE